MNSFLVPIDVDALHTLLHERALAIAADQEWADEHTKVTGQHLALRNALLDLIGHVGEFGMTDAELVATVKTQVLDGDAFRARVEIALLVDGDGLTDDQIIDYITRELTTQAEPVKVHAVFEIDKPVRAWEVGNLVEHCDNDAGDDPDGAFVAQLTRYAEHQPYNQWAGWWEAVVTEILRQPADTAGPQVGEEVKLQEGYSRNRVIGHFTDASVTETMPAIGDGSSVFEAMGGTITSPARRFHPGDACPNDLMIVREADPDVDPDLCLWTRTGDNQWTWTDVDDPANRSVMSWDEMLVAVDGGVIENIDPDAGDTQP